MAAWSGIAGKTPRLRGHVAAVLCLAVALLVSAPAPIAGSARFSRGHHLLDDRGPAGLMPMWRIGPARTLIPLRRLLEPGSLPGARRTSSSHASLSIVSSARPVETLPPHWAACHLTI